MRLRPVLLSFAALAAVPTSASAVEATGRGENITPIKNLPYPNTRAADEVNAGTDLEFATITVAPDPAKPTTPGTPTVPGTPTTPGDPAAPTAPRPAAGTQSAPAGTQAAPTAATPAQRAAAKRASAKQAAAKRKLAKRLAQCKKAKKGSKLARQCKAEARKRAAARRAAAKKAAAKAKASRRDAQPDVPGIQKTFSFAGSYGDGLHVVDVTDPRSSAIVATWDCSISQGDVQLFQRKDLGDRWFAAFTADDGYDVDKKSKCFTDLAAKGVDVGAGTGTYIADVTDPYAPKTVSFVPFAQGSHNVTVHPSGKYLYNSNSDLITEILPAIEISDITDIERPKDAGEVDLQTFPGLGTESHDVSFSADGTRAYSAALSHGEILDTTDPANPKSIGVIDDPAVNVWHQAEPITIKDPLLGEREFLIAEDEFLGAIGTGQCPNGGVHVYDITGPLEKTPIKVGYWNIDDVGLTDTTLGGCTAHVFQLDRQAQLMTIAFYNGGVRVVDLSGLVGVALGKTGMGMKEVGSYVFPDADTWAVKAPKMSRNGFTLYGNDHARGFDVYEWKPAATGSSTAGRWFSPEQALQRMQGIRALSQGKGGLRVGFVCILPPSKRS